VRNLNKIKVKINKNNECTKIMNVKLKRKKIFGKEFVFTVQDEELKSPIYRQIRGIIKEPSW